MNTINPRIAIEALPEGPFVVYSPLGSARPLVLEGKALAVLKFLQEPSVDSGVEEREKNQILEFFRTERILLGNPDNKQTRKEIKRDRLSFWVHLTNRCNLRCPYCYTYKSNLVMSATTFKSWLVGIRTHCIRNNIQKVALKFSGGEPLAEFGQLREFVSIAEKIFHNTDIRLKFSIITNGTLLSARKAQYLAEKNIGVAVSLDGVGEHNSLRVYSNGKNSFSETVAGIDNLLSTGRKPIVLSVVSSTTLPGLPNLLSFVQERGLNLSLSLIRDINKNGDLNLDTERFGLIFLTNLRQAITDTEVPPQISFSNLSFNGKRDKTCAAGVSYLSVGPKGAMSLCQMTVTNPSKEAPNSSHIGTVLDLYSPREKPQECKTCVWEHACAGGCEVMAERSNTMSAPSLHCEANKQILPLLLRLQGRRLLRAHTEAENQKP